MKLQNNLFSIQIFLIFASANLLFVSCGTYQTAYYEDGIYSNPERKQIVVVERENRTNFEENYFTKKLDSLESIADNEIFTDINTYSSNPNFSDNNENYNQNEPWGYQNDNVVVNVNLINDPFWYGNGVGLWGWNNWGWNNWGWNNWGWNRWNNWGFYGNPYWHPYANNWGWNGGFYNPYFYGGNRWNNNGYYRNNTYGRRDSNNSYGRRDSNGFTRNNSVTNRRTYFDYNSNSTNSRRSTYNTPVRRSSTVRGNESNDRNSNYSSRNNSNTNNNTNSTTRRSTETTRSSGNTSNSGRGSTSGRGGGRRGN